jgi:archaemetzincin
MPQKGVLTCAHSRLTFDPSSYAANAGYKRPALAQRVSAASSQVVKQTGVLDEKEYLSTFPAPLVLPEDELSWNPTEPQQSVRSWAKTRNKVTPERRTVYFVGPPEVEPAVDFIEKWKEPWVEVPVKDKAVDFPKTEDVLEYMGAFYHGLPVKMLPRKPCFTADVDDDVVEISPPKAKGKTAKKVPEQSPMLWLNTHTPSGCIGIRTRATPNGAFTHQLNLNDLLDAAIEILPADAYALLMLVEHDIYEDEEDDFACGRAYGGSRIAVVSGARYNPILDQDQRLERNHAWPASHCEEYMQKCCDEPRPKKKAKTALTLLKGQDGTMSPMHTALAAHMSLPSLKTAPSPAALSGLWLGRVCRTAGHELGHCFGIGHCVAYACSMQGTASIIEDARQPPYLCPIDLAKVLNSTGADEKERYRKLLQYCEKHQEAHLFAAFGAWIGRRLGAI